MKYRARGIYKQTKRKSWVTTCWRKTRIEAQDDIDLYAVGRYENTEIVEVEE